MAEMMSIQSCSKLAGQACRFMKTTPKIEPLANAEVEWVKAQLANALKFVAALSPADAGQPLSLAALDRAFASWLASAPAEVDLINAIINCVGIAFGQALVDGAGLQWVIATDKHGTDLAVHGLPGQGDVLVYPANFVAKRWERRESNFLEQAYEQIARDVREVARKWDKDGQSNLA
jgi:hypothetical protein